MPRAITKSADYTSKLLKLIPADFIAGYLAIDNTLPSGQFRKWGLTIATSVLLLLLFVTLRYLHRIKSWPQILVTCVSFVIWIYSVGGPFNEWDIYQRAVAGVALILWTFILPMFEFKS